VTRQEAKEVLLLYRPGSADAEEPEIGQAMDVARRDPELGAWFKQHCAFQTAMRDRFRQIEVPAHFKVGILATQKPNRPQYWWQRPVWMAAAAAAILFFGLVGFGIWPPVSQRFSNFQQRMVSAALREYRMDLVTSDPAKLRAFISDRGAPADYELPKKLEKLQLTGGGRLRWRNNPVTMVCLDRGNKQMLYLFVLKRAALKDPPATTPELAKVSGLQTVSWTKGDNAYLLAGPDEPGFLDEYF
jgi:hypothetical protein